MLTKFFDITFLQSIIATGIGVILGIPAALWVNSLIDKASELERKRKVLTVLKNELFADKLIIDEAGKYQVNEGFILPLLLRTETWKAFSDGGDLQWIKDPELLGTLSETYHEISSLARLSNERFDIAYFSPHHHAAVANKLNTEYSTLYDRTYNTILETLKVLENKLM